MEKHELVHKLVWYLVLSMLLLSLPQDEAVSNSEALTESNANKLQEMALKHDEQIQQYKMEQVGTDPHLWCFHHSPSRQRTMLCKKVVRRS